MPPRGRAACERGPASPRRRRRRRPRSRARSARPRGGRCRSRDRGRTARPPRRHSRAHGGTRPSGRGRGRRRSRRRPLPAASTPRPVSQVSGVVRSDSEDLGLGGRELLVGEHALSVKLRQILELRGRVVLRLGGGGGCCTAAAAARTAARPARPTSRPDGAARARRRRWRFPRRRRCGLPCVEVPCRYLSISKGRG